MPSEDITASVADANLKNLGDAPAFFIAQTMANHVQSQARLNILAESALGETIKRMQEMDPHEAIALSRTGFSSSDSLDTLAKLASLGKTVATGGI